MLSPENAALAGAVTVVFGFAPAIFIAVAPPRAAAAASMRLLTGVGLTVLAMRIGAWAFASTYLCNVAGGAFFVASLLSMARAMRAGGGKRGIALAWAVPALALLGLVGWAITGSFYQGTPIDLGVVPLGPGTYSVLQGGSSPLTNPFHDKLTERAAVDLVKLEASGNRAKMLVPHALADYASFGAPVLSPCDGEVAAVLATEPDGLKADGPVAIAVPMDERNGNYVVVKCEHALVKLGQLQQGSARVVVGARVRRGQEVARIGNSGNSPEPHLHIGAFPLETPMDRVVSASGDAPLTFADHVLVANTVFTIE